MKISVCNQKLRRLGPRRIPDTTLLRAVQCRNRSVREAILELPASPQGKYEEEKEKRNRKGRRELKLL